MENFNKLNLRDGDIITEDKLAIIDSNTDKYNANKTEILNTLDSHTSQLNDMAINVKNYGAKGDGVTDDTLAIQNAINSALKINTYLSSSGKVKKITIPAGVYDISEPIIIDSSDIEIEGLGNVVLRATSTLNDFILKVGSNSPCYNFRIKGITFAKIGSNPYESDYNSTKYGGGATYNFSTSCAGLYLGDVHHYLIDCNFVGLKLGVLLDGAWSGEFSSTCRFEYNNRHIQSRNTADGSRANNFIKVSGVFGASILNGGVALIDCNHLIMNNCDFENAHHTALYLRNCRSVDLGRLYFESNSKYKDVSGVPSNVYTATEFKTDRDDDCAFYLDGYNIALQACQSVTIDKGSHNVPGAKQIGYIINYASTDSVYIRDTRFTGGSLLQVFCTTYQDITPPYVFENCFADAIWKLHNVTGSVVKDNLLTKNMDYVIPDIYYIDLTNGDDNINNSDMTTSKRIKSLDKLFQCLPQNCQVTYTIYVKGSANTMALNNAPTGGGTFKLIGDDTVNTNIGSVYMVPVINGLIYMEKIDMTRIYEQPYNLTSDYLTSNGILHIKNCSIIGSQTAGLVIGVYGSKIIMDTVTLIDSSTAGYTMVVRNGQEIWLKNCNCNKPVKVRDFGKIFYQGITGSIPIVDTGYMGIVTAIS